MLLLFVLCKCLYVLLLLCFVCKFVCMVGWGAVFFPMHFQWVSIISFSGAGDRSSSQRRDRHGDSRSAEHVMKQPFGAVST